MACLPKWVRTSAEISLAHPKHKYGEALGLHITSSAISAPLNGPFLPDQWLNLPRPWFKSVQRSALDPGKLPVAQTLPLRRSPPPGEHHPCVKWVETQIIARLPRAYNKILINIIALRSRWFTWSKSSSIEKNCDQIFHWYSMFFSHFCWLNCHKSMVNPHHFPTSRPRLSTTARDRCLSPRGTRWLRGIRFANNKIQ